MKVLVKGRRGSKEMERGESGDVDAGEGPPGGQVVYDSEGRR